MNIPSEISVKLDQASFLIERSRWATSATSTSDVPRMPQRRTVRLSYSRAMPNRRNSDVKKVPSYETNLIRLPSLKTKYVVANAA